MRVFGCLAYAHNLNHHGDKFETRSRKCVFVGYPYGKKGWRLYDLDKKIFFVSRDVVFNEGIFPFSDEASTSSGLTSSASQSIDPPSSPDIVLHPELVGPIDPNATIDPTASIDPIDPPANNVSPDSSGPIDPLHQPIDSSSPIVENVNTTESSTNDQPVEVLGVGKRQKNPPAYLQDYVVGTVSVSHLPHLTSPAPQPSSGIDYPLSDYLSSHRFSPGYYSYLVALTTAVEPRSFKEAMTYDEWKLAMKDEVG